MKRKLETVPEHQARKPTVKTHPYRAAICITLRKSRPSNPRKKFSQARTKKMSSPRDFLRRSRQTVVGNGREWCGKVEASPRSCKDKFRNMEIKEECDAPLSEKKLCRPLPSVREELERQLEDHTLTPQARLEGEQLLQEFITKTAARSRSTKDDPAPNQYSVFPTTKFGRGGNVGG